MAERIGSQVRALRDDRFEAEIEPSLDAALVDRGLDGVKRGDVGLVALPGDYGKPRPAVIVQSPT